MWLPKDERYLLMVYYVSTPELRIEGPTFSVADLQPFVIKPPRIPILGPRKVVKLARELIKKKHNTGLTCNQQQMNTNVENNFVNQQETNNKYKVWFEAKIKIETANKMLKERGLLDVSECGSYYYKINEMKLAGLDLGRKYCSWFKRSGLLYAEYKHHWFWLIVSFLVGVIGALLVNWLSR